MSEFNTDHMDRFLKRVAGMKSDSTYNSVRAALGHFDVWLNQNEIPVTDVGATGIEDFLAHLSSKGYAPASIGLYFNNIREFYKFLSRDGVIEDNPVEDVDRGHIRSLTKGTRKSAESEIVYASTEEVETMVEHAPKPKLRNRLIIKLLYQTGIRAHECASILVDNVDRDERRIRVRSSKTDDWRSVFYRPSLDLLMTEWIDGGYRDAYEPGTSTSYLFPSKQADHLSSDSIGRIVRKSAERAGIQEVMYVDAKGNERVKYGAHCLRHGAAVWYIRNGGDIRTLQRLLGHHDISMTEKYLELIDSDLKDAYDRVSASAPN